MNIRYFAKNTSEVRRYRQVTIVSQVQDLIQITFVSETVKEISMKGINNARQKGYSIRSDIIMAAKELQLTYIY